MANLNNAIHSSLKKKLKWVLERKCRKVGVKELHDELERRTNDLETTRHYQRELEVSLEEKEK